MKKALVALLLLFAVTVKVCALDVEINRGIHASIPIAVLPFANDLGVAAGHEKLSQIIASDLAASGQFRIVAANVGSDAPADVKQLNFKQWQQKGANDIVLGRVEALSDERYQVSFQLVSAYNSDADGRARDPSAAVLLSQTFKVDQPGLRELAHHISDEIYQRLTGIKGVFSTKIAYVLTKQQPEKLPRYSLEVADFDGFNSQALLVSSQPIMSPAWSPNGHQLAYVSFENFQPEVYVQDIRTGKRKLISAFAGINGAPAFSPDGAQLALVLTSTGNPNLYLYDLNARRLRQLTNGYAIDTEPTWTPDGKAIVFTSGRAGNPQLYRYTLATGKIERLTFDGNYNAKATITPDGKTLVMMHREKRLFGIARQDLVSGRSQILTQTGAEESPSVAPNGKMVVYATQAQGRAVLAMMSIDGRHKMRLPARDGNVQEPAWSPFDH